MKQLLFYFLLMCSFQGLAQVSTGSGGGSSSSGNNNYRNYTRFDMGYEHINYFMGPKYPNTNSATFMFEMAFKKAPMFSRNYRLSIGMNDSNQFYMHIPGGPVLGIIAALIVANSNSPASSCGGIGVGALLFILPDGLAVTPIQNDRFSMGFYANFIGIDYTNRPNKPLDYAPDVGVRVNAYFNDSMFAFTRISGKYSSVFKGWGAQGSIGIGWDFNRD